MITKEIVIKYRANLKESALLKVESQCNGLLRDEGQSQGIGLRMQIPSNAVSQSNWFSHMLDFPKGNLSFYFILTPSRNFLKNEEQSQ